MSDEKILLFPSREARGLTDLQRILRENIVDEEITLFVYERIRGMWANEIKRRLDLNIDENERANIDRVTAFFRESNDRLILELVKAYIELYEALQR